MIFEYPTLKFSTGILFMAQALLSSRHRQEISPDSTSLPRPGDREAYPLISIVIPSFNQGNYLEATLNSLFSQKYPRLDCIVIDGGSTDNTLALLDTYDSMLACRISEPDRGQADALNKGFARAKGEILGWLNSDDTLEPGSLFRIAAAFNDHGRQIVMASHYRLIDAAGHFLQRKENSYHNRTKLIRYWQNNGMSINQPSVFFRADLFNRVRAVFDPNLHYAMDYDLWLQLSQQAGFTVIPDCWANYRLHGASKTGQGFSRFFPEWNRVSRKYRGSWLSLQPYLHLTDFLFWTAKNTGKEPLLIQQDSTAEPTGFTRLTNEENPLVSVIISNYNYGRFLESALNSALEQTYQQLEVIVVDDGSTDDSQQVLSRFQDRITVLFQENSGQAAAFNAAFRKCCGEIICFLDADDCWQQNKVAEIVKKFREQCWGTVFHDLTVEYTDTSKRQRLYSELNKKSLIGGFLYPGFLLGNAVVNFIPSSGMSITRTLAKRIFPLHEQGWQICADTQIAFAAACFAPMGIIDQPLAIYRIHGRNQYSSLQGEKSEQAQVLDLINKQLCLLKFKDLSREMKEELISPMSNFLVLRRWLWMTAPLSMGLLTDLWKKNIYFFKNNPEVYYKKTAIVKFILLDTIIFLFLLLKIPCRRSRLRTIFFTDFAERYRGVFSGKQRPDLKG
jgi:glycosyltransferase involved in cell wall biosynthesis